MFSNQKFLIVLDLDGTLLNSGKTVTPKTAEYLRHFVFGFFVFAGAYFAYFAYKSLISTFLICYNGSSYTVGFAFV